MLLGDTLLVKPITRPMMYLPHSAPIENPDEWECVYLPAGHDWYDLNTGEHYAGGQTVRVHAPLDVIPMFARAGSILPWGGDVQHTGELAHAPLTLRIFPGEDGDFTLYDDAGDGYGCERGEFSLIPLHWDDSASKLTIGAREGAYPGMPQERTLIVHRAGGKPVEIRYTGQALSLSL